MVTSWGSLISVPIVCWFGPRPLQSASNVTLIVALSAEVHLRLARFSIDRIVSYHEPRWVLLKSYDVVTPASINISLTSLKSRGSAADVTVAASRGENC